MDVCSHRPPCPGCPRFAEPGVASGALARLERLAAETGAELSNVESAAPIGHRHRARLMVRGRAASPKIGLFQTGSHRIVDTPQCQVHHPVINRVAAALKRAIRATSAAPYADAPHRGLVRALQVAVERASQRAQVVVVVNALDPESSRPLLDVFARELDDDGDLHSLWWNGNAERSNVILGARWHHCSGPTALVETIGNARVFFPPGAFGQSHLALADRIVAAVHALARGTDRIAEWYAGCGAFGLGLLARGADVAFNEESPHALTGLGRGIEELGTAAKLRAEIVPGRAGDCPQLARDRELGLVDPPRRGLDPELLAALCAEPPPRLAYVSCGVESLERDARALSSSGRLRLQRLVPYALFPFTEHVETLAVFECSD
jgi:23S rRNA (uracil1939-C5)-methyltransferase